MNDDITPPSHEFILDTVSARYGMPSFCYFFGSHAFGRGNDASDIDIIVVLSKVAQPYRETFSANGFLFDAQVHDPETLHFMMRSEYKSGLAIMAGKVDQSVVLPEPSDLATRLKEIARQMLDSGPVPQRNWDTPRRYMTATLSDLERCADSDEQRVIAMDVYVKTLDLFMRSHGQFSGQGRYLVRSAKKLDAAFVERARAALEQVFRDGSVASLTQLAREVIDRIGGPLHAGYRQPYPEISRLPLR